MAKKYSKIGIITGSGIKALDVLKQTPLPGKKLFVINRHGKKYQPPARINYRANLQGLRRKKVQAILATAAVGSLQRGLRPGDFVLLTDFIDFTAQRRPGLAADAFIDLSQPYHPDLRAAVIKAAKKLRLRLCPRATYVCTEGPRFESKAEIKMFARLGADVVGMTQVPEVLLAAQAKIPYAVIAVVTNYAAGLSPKKVSAAEVMSVMQEKRSSLCQLLRLTVAEL